MSDSTTPKDVFWTCLDRVVFMTSRFDVPRPTGMFTIVAKSLATII